MKRLFDVFVSLVMLLTMVPIMLFVALMVLVSLGRPIVFIQDRPGLHGKPFQMYKFRTMLDKKNKDGVLLSDGERLTRTGQFLRMSSLDELPELWNVIKGDMSLVGPRPLLMEYLPLYSEEQFRRHEVKPGITGLAQVNGRNDLDWEDKFRLDVWYVDNRTFWLDMKILALTFWKVLAREGIAQEGNVTMEKFNGK